jgi:hypothetical protein
VFDGGLARLRYAVGLDGQVLDVREVVGRERAVFGLDQRLVLVGREVVREQFRPVGRRRVREDHPILVEDVLAPRAHSEAGDAVGQVELPPLAGLEVVDHGHRHRPATPSGGPSSADWRALQGRRQGLLPCSSSGRTNERGHHKSNQNDVSVSQLRKNPERHGQTAAIPSRVTWPLVVAEADGRVDRT